MFLGMNFYGVVLRHWLTVKPLHFSSAGKISPEGSGQKTVILLTEPQKRENKI